MPNSTHCLREARRMLDASRDRKAELSTALVKLQSDAEYLAQTCVNELGVQRVELMADTTLPRVSGEELAVEEQACQEMRARLDAMGPVNMMALEEYKETAERQAFLDTQRKDLLDSIENTQATIKEIDTFSRQKFEEAFNKINENFQVTFKKLFGGGNAFMRLTDLENSNAMESGIDVVASPPGKRLQNVLLLSGGEKAMTALALLVGIFQYQPSPFCILDEVDAPLDEANIGRFTELVEEMSVQHPVRPHHPQQEDDEHRAGAVRRDHAGAGSFEAGVGAVWGDGASIGVGLPFCIGDSDVVGVLRLRRSFASRMIFFAQDDIAQMFAEYFPQLQSSEPLPSARFRLTPLCQSPIGGKRGSREIGYHVSR